MPDGLGVGLATEVGVPVVNLGDKGLGELGDTGAESWGGHKGCEAGQLVHHPLDGGGLAALGLMEANELGNKGGPHDVLKGGGEVQVGEAEAKELADGLFLGGNGGGLLGGHPRGAGGVGLGLLGEWGIFEVCDKGGELVTRGGARLKVPGGNIVKGEVSHELLLGARWLDGAIRELRVPLAAPPLLHHSPSCMGWGQGMLP